jgi:glycerol-3-phosphate dehydrogenase
VIARSELLERVRSGGPWDVLVIGGGATGLGAAVDAAARGYRTLVLEAHDFAKGTSSRSTKLVHGGVRYLAQGRIGLVREALHERGILFRNAPHLVHALPFVLPTYSRASTAFYWFGLKLYDLLAGRLGIGGTRRLNAAEVIERAPTLTQDRLSGGLEFHDGQFDDARLAITLVRTLFDLGGTAINYLPVKALAKQSGRVRGVEAYDAESGESFRIEARAVVNAAGVYVDALRQLDDPSAGSVIVPSQGAHLVLARSFLPGRCAVLFPRTDDGRVLFAIPWHDRVIIGTTDTPVDRVPIEPRALPHEVAFLTEHTGRYLGRNPCAADVLSVYAGLRPLVRSATGRSTADLSRSHRIWVSDSGLVTITGGKWTTYRRMGAETIDHAVRVGALAVRPSATETLKLHGWCERVPEEPFAVYGSDAFALQQLRDERPGLSAPLHPRLPYFAAEVAWAAQRELARSVEDVLARRTRALLIDARASIEAAPRVAAILAEELGFDDAWQRAQVKVYGELAQGYLLA